MKTMENASDPHTPAHIGAEINGPGRIYFESVVTDNLLESFMELAAEVWIIRDRQAVLEAVLKAQGIDAATLIEAHRPSKTEAAERKALRAAFANRLLAGFLRRPDTLTTEETPS
jgi:hypothetical protein